MCKSRRRRKQSNAQTGMTDDEMRAEIARLNEETRRIQANTATILAETEDIKAGQAGTIMKEETAAQSTVSLDQQLAALGGSQQAIADIQQETFQEVKGATDKEKMEIRKRKEQQLQRAIRQRRKSGFQGRRSLITGQSGGRGYA
tara:strand:+ start:1029 stop:1463 length:435 start_codon:yes stop_codon:yes gene_type:complete